jgi:RNA polymerase sigma-70 factor (ECF subfamily)
MPNVSTRDPAHAASAHGEAADAAHPPHAVAMDLSVAAKPDNAQQVAGWYREHFAFVWRTLRRFGVSRQNLDDAAQDVFLVAARRAHDFDRDLNKVGSERAWLFGIARHVAFAERRKLRAALHSEESLVERAAIAEQADPQESALSSEAAALVQAALAEVDEDKRWVFILSDLENMSGPELARALDLNLNTAYARLRAARKQFVANVRRLQARAR